MLQGWGLWLILQAVVEEVHVLGTVTPEAPALALHLRCWLHLQVLALSSLLLHWPLRRCLLHLLLVSLLLLPLVLLLLLQGLRPAWRVARRQRLGISSCGRTLQHTSRAAWHSQVGGAH